MTNRKEEGSKSGFGKDDSLARYSELRYLAYQHFSLHQLTLLKNILLTRKGAIVDPVIDELIKQKQVEGK